MENNKNYYIGLDIGTNSVGYAVTDEDYMPLRYKGEMMMGTHLFEEAQDGTVRRAARTARRRLDRRQFRAALVGELFASEIAAVDPNFFRRKGESALWRDQASEPYTIFNDPDYTDRQFHRQYPTIHHLIAELMRDRTPHDVRLVYLAVVWLVAHRGHFLQEIDSDNVDKIVSFASVFEELKLFFEDNDIEYPWERDIDPIALGEALKTKVGIKRKKELLAPLFFAGKAPVVDHSEAFPYSRSKIVDLLCGSTIHLKDLYLRDEYAEDEVFKGFSLNAADDKMEAVFAALGDDADLLRVLKCVNDWALLADILQGRSSISEAKVAIYDQHKRDLKTLKYIIKKYVPDQYAFFFRSERKGSYSCYVGHYKSFKDKIGKVKNEKDDFVTALKKALKKIEVNEVDRAIIDDMLARLELNAFLPLQVNGDNRVIPYQLYFAELKKVLDNASAYLPWLSKTDSEGLTVTDKLQSIMTFRVPYYVGPLRRDGNPHAWICRKQQGRITPWNFDNLVDREASEKSFIDRMLCRCTYYPGAYVLPKYSLLYARFQVLNEINNIRINGVRISPELKQRIYNDLYLQYRKVTYKRICDYLRASGYDGEVSGVDKEGIKSNLAAAHDFARLLSSGALTERQVEYIIERITYTDDKIRLYRWLQTNYPQLPEADLRYIMRLRYKDFGRLSRSFLDGDLLGADKRGGTGEMISIIRAMWETDCNLMELLSDRFTFREELELIRRDYYADHPVTLQARMDELYLSPVVKRQVMRTLDVVSDIVKARKGAPTKIFVEMARGEKEKKDRTVSRYDNLMKLYKSIKSSDVDELRRELQAMGEQVDNRLQSDKIYLYYMQLGKCMYTGERIDLARLMQKDQSLYNIEHIYPQSKVKDDSINNNRVLVLSKVNGDKSDVYPIDPAIQRKMRATWTELLRHELITEEKFKRLVRTTTFNEEELKGFINRQLVETRQSTKAVTQLFKELYPETTIVYVKAGLVSDFRQEFGILKCRLVNDLHHAKDAYLNVVVGNVWYERFTRNFYVDREPNYSIKVETVFGKNQWDSAGRQIWRGGASIGMVKKVMTKNAIHLTRYQFVRGGAFFDLQPVSAAPGLVPLKKGMDTERYGGYNKPTAAFFVPVRYSIGKKTDITILAVDALISDRFLSDSAFAREYAERSISELFSGKAVRDITFPFGDKILRVNTVFDLDGFRVTLSGKSGGGKTLIVSTAMPLIVGYQWERYIKRLERFAEKNAQNAKLQLDEEYEHITRAENLALYDVLLSKATSRPYSLRPNMPVDVLKNGREKFEQLSLIDQVIALLSMIQLFSGVSGGVDLRLIDGSQHTGATVNFSANVSNWKKNYKEAHIIYTSSSGIYESESVDLFSLL